MKRVMLAFVAVVFLCGISSVSFATGMGDEMKDQSGTMKDEGMKKGHEEMGGMKEKGTEMSPDAKGKDMPGKIEAQGKEKTSKTKKKPMKEEPMEK